MFASNARIRAVNALGEVASIQSLWLVVLSSSVVSAVMSAIVSGYFTWRSKRDEYVNEYYKTVIKRRIVAYEKIEQLIIWLKSAVIDPQGQDRRPYHLLFSDDSGWNKAQELLADINIQGLWVSDEIFKKAQELNRLIFNKPQNVIAFGKANYERIATMRAELERLLARDILSLHDVKNFLKSKDSPDAGFEIVHLGQ